MSDTVIKVENISKLYRLGEVGTGTLRHDFNRWWHKIRGKEDPYLKIGAANDRTVKGDSDFVWALKDINFEVKRGEVLGIIGRNGAGKSTLLKILSRVTMPTSGEIKVKGRIASLLEVATGFNPELTGRDNIYLNGAILGMRKQEIDSKFDEIVDFSGVERYIDTPVKRYSSGMYVRLAFAVAAHLEPEILIVDEVLAVGDVEFQKKCMGKIQEVAQGQGRTVLFVSHNMGAIEQLCSRVLLLERGYSVLNSSGVPTTIRRYLSGSIDNEQRFEWINSGNEYVNPWFQPQRFYLSDASGNVLKSAITNNADAWVHIEAVIEQIDPALSFGYLLSTEDSKPLFFCCQTDLNREKWPQIACGIVHLRSKFPKHLLNEGTYLVELTGGLYYRDWLVEPGRNAPCIRFTIQGGISESPYWMGKRLGLLAPLIPWEKVSI